MVVNIALVVANIVIVMGGIDIIVDMEANIAEITIEKIVVELYKVLTIFFFLFLYSFAYLQVFLLINLLVYLIGFDHDLRQAFYL